MNQRSCASLPLVEAAHDGRLGKRDIESLQRHVSTCDECRDFALELDALRDLAQQPGAALSPLEARRTRVRLLRSAARPKPSHEKHRKRWITGVVILAAVAFVLFQFDRPVNAQRSVQSGVREHALALGQITMVRPSEGTVFTRQTKDGIDQISLDDGKLDIAVRPLHPGERFVVLTRDAEVEVRGTMFGVESESKGIRRVFVVEGKVEVRHAGAIFFVEAGGEWFPPKIREKEANGIEASSDSVLDHRESQTRPKGKNATTTPNASSAHAAVSADATSTQFGDAVGAMEKGNYGTATERLEQFAREHPEDVRAEDAAFLAILAMKRSGRDNDAADAARRYLARFPKGFRRVEAEGIAAGGSNRP